MGFPIREIQYAPPSKIKRNPTNPRKHSRGQIQKIADSMLAFGFNVPILVDQNWMCVAGHGRLEASELLKLPSIPVIRLEDLTERQARAFMLTDNKLAELSSWDEELLVVHLKELSDLSLDFNVEITGFDMAEIDLLIQESASERNTKASDAFEITKGPPVALQGDLFTLGDHRILCGSALDVKSYEVLLDGVKVIAVFTDPPYNLKIDGVVSGLGKIKHREFAMASGEMKGGQFQEFLADILAHSRRALADGGICYACMDWRHVCEIVTAGKECGLELINICVWVKSNGGMGSFYRSQHEFVCVFRNGASSHRNNVQLGRFGRNRTNVWNYAGASATTEGSTKLLEFHPTVKPVNLVADALLDCTARGDAVLDPFLGSGTTILAAEQTGRRGFGIELDPVYVDTAIIRWEKLTGLQAVHQSGATFKDLKRERTAP